MPVVLYRWSQYEAWTIPPPTSTYVGYFPFIGIGAYVGDGSFYGGVGCGAPGAPGANLPKSNGTLERFSRGRNAQAESFMGEGYISPYGCGTHAISNGATYRFIVQAGDSGWVAYYLYLKVNWTWYQVRVYSEQIAPPGSTPGGTFNQNRGGIAIGTTEGVRDFTINFTNVQYGAFYN